MYDRLGCVEMLVLGTGMIIERIRRYGRRVGTVLHGQPASASPDGVPAVDSSSGQMAPTVGRVLAMVSNPARNDSRVQKQSKSLVDAGYEVVLLAAADPALPVEETWQGVQIRRYPMFDVDVAIGASQVDAALQNFGSQKDLIRSRYLDLVAAKRLVDAADEALKIAVREARPIPSTSPMKDVARKRVATAKTLRERASLSYVARRQENMVYLRHLLFALNFLKNVPAEQFDIVHSHDLYPLAAALMIAKRDGAAVVYDAHELEVERLPVMTPDRKDFIRKIEDGMILRIDGMITVSDSIANVYAERTGKRPIVIYNAPDVRVGSEAGMDVRSAAGIERDVPLIVFTGNVGREGRGLHEVVSALKLLPDFHLAILGPRHVANDSWLVALAVESGVDHRLHLLPPVAPEQVIHASRTADVGICPIQDASLSYQFAMPNKLFEMAFAGLPIAVSNLPDMSRFVTENSVGLVMDQTDPNSIARVIRELVERRGEFSHDSATRARMIAEYSWAAQETRLIDLYSRLSTELPSARVRRLDLLLRTLSEELGVPPHDTTSIASGTELRSSIHP